MTEMTAEILFLRYAYPCINSKWGQEMPGEHRLEIEAAVFEGKQPRRKTIKFHFPRAFKALRELGEQTERDPWHIENVIDYWHSHQGMGPACAVIQMTVLHAQPADQAAPPAAMLQNGSKQIPMNNTYRLELKPGDKVYTHQAHIIEKA